MTFPSDPRDQALEWVQAPPAAFQESAISRLLDRFRSDRAWQRRLAWAGGAAAIVLLVLAWRRSSHRRG